MSAFKSTMIWMFFVGLLCFAVASGSKAAFDISVATDSIELAYDENNALKVVPAHYGYQPANTADFDDPRLIHDFNAYLKSNYVGMFELDRTKVTPHPELPAVTPFQGAAFTEQNFTGLGGAIALGDGNRLFVSSRNGQYQTQSWTGEAAGLADSISEYVIPGTLLNNINDLNNRTGIQSATQTQPWSSVFRARTGVTGTSDRSSESISGMYYNRENNRLCMSVQEDYDVAPHSNDNLICYDNPNDLTNSPVRGFFSVKAESGSDDQAQHAAGWFADVPVEHRTRVGGKTLFGGGGTASIIRRLPVGPTLFGGTLDGLGTGGHVQVTRFLDYDDETAEQLGAQYFVNQPNWPSGYTWYELGHMNCDPFLPPETFYNCGQATTDSSLVVPWINNFWTIESYGVQGFIIPGTDTYAVIGQIGGIEGGVSYKGNPAWNGGSNCPGACTVQVDDYNYKYCLFDLKDLGGLSVGQAFPYEHGTIPMLDRVTTMSGNRSIMMNATFDMHSGRLIILMRARAGSTFNPNADGLVFQLPSESVN